MNVCLFCSFMQNCDELTINSESCNIWVYYTSLERYTHLSMLLRLVSKSVAVTNRTEHEINLKITSHSAFTLHSAFILLLYFNTDSNLQIKISTNKTNQLFLANCSSEMLHLEAFKTQDFSNIYSFFKSY
jgi:hypothetical protein